MNQMIYKYGIDFGTTNSSIAIRFVGEDEVEHTLVVDVKDTLPRETMPSVVFADDKGHIIAGEEALNAYTPETDNYKNQIFIKKIKLDLENKGSELSYQVGKRKIQGVDLIAAILKMLRLKAKKMADELEINMSGVVMGVPVQYGDIQKNILKQALVKAGYYANYKESEQKTEFVSEPVAVAVHYGLNLKHDTTVLVFDFGGGTLDLAIVNLKQQVNADKLHPHETISKERITLGGEELTRLFFINSFCSAHKYGAKRISAEFGFNSSLSPEKLWEKLLHCEEGIRFISAIEKCKCELSISSRYRFSFIGRNIQLEEKSFYSDDFENAIQEKLEEIDEVIDICLEEGNKEPFDIDRVLLAGGSSMIPAVQNVLTNKFGVRRVSNKINDKDSVIKSLKRNRVSENEVLTSIVRGLAMIGCKEESLIDDIVDSDYGVWDSINNELIPIITKGTPIKKTVLDKITLQGISEDVRCVEGNFSSVEVKVFQRNITGDHKLGTINILNPGGKEYKIFMEIDKKKNMLEVTIYDKIRQRWIDEIPLNERQYILR